MSDPALTAERILEAAEDVLRRFGPTKATVVDVARALGVSHGAVYRHFPSKAALRDAVAERWLTRVSKPLAAVASESGPTPQRLRRWFDALIAFKRRKAIEDPELFATYSRLVADSRRVVHAHIEALTGQLSRIIADGMSRGEFKVRDADAAAQAVFDATARFHNPSHAQEWSDPAIGRAFEAVWALLLGGLGVSSTKKRAPRSGDRVS